MFDCHAEYGPRPGKHRLERWTLEHLLADLDLAGIDGALVKHAQGLHYEPMYANRRLVRELAPHRARLFPCWAVVPPIAGEFPAPDELLREMAEADVRAVVMYPASCGIEPFAPLVQPLADALAERQVPLLLSFPELGGFAGGHRWLELFADIPVILTDSSWGCWRAVRLLMDHHPNLHLELSSFQANRALEDFGAAYGPGRILFGTNLPYKAPGAARGFYDWPLGDEAEAELFGGGNLQRLLGVGPTGTAQPTPWNDSITADADARRPLSCPVLNAHSHVLHDGAGWAGKFYVQPHGDTRGILELCDRVGIDAVAMMSWNGTVSMDMSDGNAIVAAAVAQAPERLLGVVTLDPSHMSPETMQRELDYYHLELKFPGLKHDIATTLPFNHELFDPWWSFGHEHHLYVLFDQPISGLPPILDVARRYPDLQVLLAHTGRSFEFAELVVAMATECPNVHAELTYTAVPNGLIEWLCTQIGSERVLFGTDSPMRDVRPQLDWVVRTRLPESDKRRILGGNFHRILSGGRLPGFVLPPGFQIQETS